MQYKNVISSFRSVLPASHAVANSSTPNPRNIATGLRVVSAADVAAHRAPSPVVELVFLASRRCSSFFAEAAVLVLVFGILDYFMLKGRVELPWIVGALAISIGLLAGSIAMDLGTRRWIKAHP